MKTKQKAKKKKFTKRNLEFRVSLFIYLFLLQIAGWSQSFGKMTKDKNVTHLTFATVRGGANFLPSSSPSEALTLFKAFLKGSPLPRTKSTS